MSELVSKNDVNHLSHEYKQTLKTLLAFIFDKIRASQRNSDNTIEIKVDKDCLYKSKIGQEPTENRLTGKNIQQIQTAFENPRSLKGSVSIFIGKEKVFHAQNGKVIKDSLQLIPELKQSPKGLLGLFKPNPETEIELKLAEALKVDNAKELVQHANQMLDALGTRNDDQSLRYEGNNYILSKKDQQLSVVSKDGRGEILNNNGFTKIATDEDKSNLNRIEEVANQLKDNNDMTQLPSCEQATWKMN
jgi:hypothetical protein